jgi:hypothetical protein
MKTPILEVPGNARLLALVRKIDEYLLKKQRTPLSRQLPGSSGRPSSAEEESIQKKHVSGLRIKGTLKEVEQSVTLQIFLDPLRFETWTKSMGPVDIFYMDPYGIEICFDKQWWIAVDCKKVPFKTTSEIYELARIDVVNEDGERRPMRIS